MGLLVSALSKKVGNSQTSNVSRWVRIVELKKLCEVPVDYQLFQNTIDMFRLTALSLGFIAIFFCSIVHDQEKKGSSNQASTKNTRTVYSNDFEQKAGDEWSKKVIGVTPVGERKFLGNFGPEKVGLSLSDLPEHRFVRVTFDLFLIESWDGSSRNWGPDLWELSVRGGPRLVYATFTNCGYFSDNNVQSFPDDYPLSKHKGWTGASEKQSLGYKWFFKRDKGKGYLTDGVYRMSAVFPHSVDSLILDFQSRCEDTKEDQSWGLDNVKVETVASAVKLSDEEMNQCWESFAGTDPVTSFNSVWQMIGSGEQAVEFLDGKLRITPVKEEAEVIKLLNDLKAEEFEKREHASTQLIRLGGGIIPILRKKLEDTKSDEVRFRLNAILKQLKPESKNPAELLRRQRVLKILRVIESRKARELQTFINPSED